jgi:Mor family transcriptional regulator
MSERIYTESGLIDAIALALVRALSDHGVTPAAGNATVHKYCAELCLYFGGDTHWMPQTYRAGRDTVIVEAVKNGASLREAARKVGVHHETVRRIVKRQSAGLGREDWVL